MPSLRGTIHRVTFHNADNGFAVLRVQVKGRRNLATVVGTAASASEGEDIEATGAWTKDAEHGLQFRADTLQTTPPHSAEGIERFLGSGVIRGIGPHFARKIVAVFGERTLAVLDESPSYLREIKGVGPRRIQRIRSSWEEHKAVRELILFLQAHGVGQARAIRIYKTYGDKAIAVVRENPYRLASDIWGIGFTTADDLAKRLGIEPDSPLRARAAIRYVLDRLTFEGHCAYPESGVIARTAELTSIDASVIASAVTTAIAEGDIVRDDPPGEEPWLYLQHLHAAETSVAKCIIELNEGRHASPRAEEQATIDRAQERIGLELALAQREAIRQATISRVLVITGGPGVGKTTIVRGILEVFSEQGLRCALAAPTGRAAKRLAESTGRNATTIHRLLEFGGAGGFQRNRKRPLEVDRLIVDEASMLDLPLMHHLLRAIPLSACLILVGDVDQLPSVGPGTVLADIIASREVPVIRLTEIFRQARESWIVRAAHQVLQGERPESAPDATGDFFFIEEEELGPIADIVTTLVRERIPSRFGLDPMRDIQVLTPMNRSELGARALNGRLQEVLNPASDSAGGPVGFAFRPGDKVIQTVNNYQKDVFNGDVGRVRKIDAIEQEMIVDHDGREVVYDFGELDELALAYALTIHKSQGSEYPAVVIPLHTQHFLLLQRNLLYTAITRGKRLVVVVGSSRALGLAVSRQDTRRRCTRLARRLHGEAAVLSLP
jgi:exodeoxyribonuclease V alpha subunit